MGRSVTPRRLSSTISMGKSSSLTVVTAMKGATEAAAGIAEGMIEERIAHRGMTAAVMITVVAVAVTMIALVAMTAVMTVAATVVMIVGTGAMIVTAVMKVAAAVRTAAATAMTAAATWTTTFRSDR